MIFKSGENTRKVTKETIMSSQYQTTKNLAQG